MMRNLKLTLYDRIRMARLFLSGVGEYSSLGRQLHAARRAIEVLRLTEEEEQSVRELDPPLRPGD